MSENKHNWKQGEVQGYQAFHCDKCHYTVVAYPDPELGGGTAHLPDHKVILVGVEKITAEDADKACKIWGIDCKVG